MRGPRIFLALATALISVTFIIGARAQSLAPSSLGGDNRSDEVKNDVVQVITAKTAPTISKKTKKLLTESTHTSAEKPVRVATQKATHAVEKAPSRTSAEKPVRVAAQKPAETIEKAPSRASAEKPVRVAAQKPAETIEKAPSRATFTMEPIRPMNQPTVNQTVQHGSRFSFRSLQGKKESVPVISDYYPKRLVYPYANIDRRIDNRLVQAASLAQERAHAHSRSRCWHYVKDALLASGVIDSRPKTDLARDAASELVNNYGFKKLSITDPFAAPVGSVLVYGTARSVGHVEIRTKDGFVSDFRSSTPSKRPLMGVYAKL